MDYNKGMHTKDQLLETMATKAVDITIIETTSR